MQCSYSFAICCNCRGSVELAAGDAGCPMGDVPTRLVPHGSLVRIPAVAVSDDSATSERSSSCYRVCTCGRHNLLHQCRDVGCVRHDHCQLEYGMIQGNEGIVRLQRILPPKSRIFRSSKSANFVKNFCHKSRISPVFRQPKTRPFQQCITVITV